MILRRLASFAAFVVGSAIVYACSSAEDPKPTYDGTCIPFEAAPGQMRCAMSKPQGTSPSETTTTTRSLGLLDSLAPIADGVLPADADIRKRCTVPIHNQGDTGWCTAHVATTLLEYAYCFDAQKVKVSTAHLWYEGHARAPFDATAVAAGWEIEHALRTIVRGSYVGEETWKTVAEHGTDHQKNADAMNGARPAPEVLACGPYATEAVQIGKPEPARIKSVLAEGRPVGISVAMFRGAGWDNAQKGAIVAVSSPKGCFCKCPDGEKCDTCPGEANCLLGYHAVTLVAYEDKTQSFTFQNSWGENEWGNKGFGTMSYAFVDQATVQSAGAVVKWATPEACKPPLPPVSGEGGTGKGPCVVYNNGFDCMCGEAAKFQKDGVPVDRCTSAATKTKLSCTQASKDLCLCVSLECHDYRGPGEDQLCLCGTTNQSLQKCLSDTGTTAGCNVPQACPADVVSCCATKEGGCNCDFDTNKPKGTCAAGETPVPNCTTSMLKVAKAECP